MSLTFHHINLGFAACDLLRTPAAGPLLRKSIQDVKELTSKDLSWLMAKVPKS